MGAKVSLMKTNQAFNSLVAASFTQINDEVYCNLLDIDIDPGDAYQIAYIDVPLSGIEPEYIESNLSEDFDDVDAFPL